MVAPGFWEIQVHILIIGAAGMVGRKLIAGLLKAGSVGGKPIERLTLADVVAHYDRVRSLGLTADQQRDLVEYLKSR